jgi:hypothetical protein
MARREEMRGRGTVKGPGPTAMESITVQQSRSRHSRGDHGIAEERYSSSLLEYMGPPIPESVPCIAGKGGPHRAGVDHLHVGPLVVVVEVHLCVRVCVCVRACGRACVRACVCVCGPLVVVAVIRLPPPHEQMRGGANTP